MFKIFNKVHLDAVQIHMEIKDFDMVKNEVEIQTELFAREFQRGVKNMFKKLE